MSPGDGARRGGHSPWLWVSVGLAAIAVGLLVWAIVTRSDLNTANSEVKDLQTQVDEGQKAGSTAAAAYQSAYQDLEQDLGATNADLEATKQDLDKAEQEGAQAAEDAAAAEKAAAQASDDAEKAKAQAEQAQAEVKAAESRTTVVRDCAGAYASAFSSVLKSDDPRGAASALGQDLQDITGQKRLSGCRNFPFKELYPSHSCSATQLHPFALDADQIYYPRD